MERIQGMKVDSTCWQAPTLLPHICVPDIMQGLGSINVHFMQADVRETLRHCSYANSFTGTGAGRDLRCHEDVHRWGGMWGM